MTEHCQQHEENVKTIATLVERSAMAEKDTETLYKYLEEYRKDQRDICASVKAMNATMAAGFKNIEQRLSLQDQTSKELETKIESSCKALEVTFNEFKVAMGKKIAEFEDFSWFRRAVNAIRNRMFFSGLILFVGIVMTLAVMHMISEKFWVLLKMVAK